MAKFFGGSFLAENFSAGEKGGKFLLLGLDIVPLLLLFGLGAFRRVLKDEDAVATLRGRSLAVLPTAAWIFQHKVL
jgi:hypothetical protein